MTALGRPTAEWRFLEDAGQFVCDRDGRQLVVAWDAGDRSFYLSVRVPPRANMAGGERLYVGPLSLLAAMTLLPRAHHATLVATVGWAYHEVADGVLLEAVHEVIDKAPQGWPHAVKAADALKRAAEAAPVLERLANDLASASAWSDLEPV